MSDCNLEWNGEKFKVDTSTDVQDASTGSSNSNIIKAVINKVNMGWLTGQMVLFVIIFLYSLGYGIYVKANFKDYKLIAYFLVVFGYLLYTIIVFNINKSEFEVLAKSC